MNSNLSSSGTASKLNLSSWAFGSGFCLTPCVINCPDPEVGNADVGNCTEFTLKSYFKLLKAYFDIHYNKFSAKHA